MVSTSINLDILNYFHIPRINSTWPWWITFIMVVSLVYYSFVDSFYIYVYYKCWLSAHKRWPCCQGCRWACPEGVRTGELRPPHIPSISNWERSPTSFLGKMLELALVAWVSWTQGSGSRRTGCVGCAGWGSVGDRAWWVEANVYVSVSRHLSMSS